MAGSSANFERINDEVWRIGFGFVEMYVYSKAGCTICIDAGFGKNGVLAGLRNCGIDPGSVNAIFLTHTDMDHTAGLSVMPGAKLYISAEEKQMIDGTTPRFFGLIKNKIARTDYTLLKDEDVVRISGTEIRCLLTPGHTPGSMSYLVSGKNLFVGDILNLKKGRTVMDRGIVMMDKAKQKKSIERLAKIAGISLLATAHSGYSKDPAFAMEEWKKDAL